MVFFKHTYLYTNERFFNRNFFFYEFSSEKFADSNSSLLKSSNEKFIVIKIVRDTFFLLFPRIRRRDRVRGNMVQFCRGSSDWREVEIFRSRRVSCGVNFPVGISTHAVTAPTFRPEQVCFINPRSRQSCEFDNSRTDLSLVDNFFFYVYHLFLPLRR